MKRIIPSVLGYVTALIIVFLLSSLNSKAQVIINGVQQIGAAAFSGASSFTSGSTLTFVSGSTLTAASGSTITIANAGFAAGSQALPSIHLTGTNTTGFYFPSTTNIYTSNTSFGVGAYGTGAMFLTNSSIQGPALATYSWSATANEQGTQDTGFSRISAGVVGVGNGSQGDFSGTIKVTTINAVTAFQANGAAGATHAACTVAVTAITVTNGIITSITCT
jgi:hypothetical protein